MLSIIIIILLVPISSQYVQQECSLSTPSSKIMLNQVKLQLQNPAPFILYYFYAFTKFSVGCIYLSPRPSVFALVNIEQNFYLSIETKIIGNESICIFQHTQKYI